MSSTDEGFAPTPQDQIDALVTIIELVRTGRATTRPEIGRVSGLGRSIVTQRVEQAIELGFLADADLGPSTGGRAPRQMRFVAERAHILIAVFGALGVGVAIADLAGEIVASRHQGWDISEGPEPSLQNLAGLFTDLMADNDISTIWGIAVGVPGPVEFRTGRPVAPPIMPGWNGFDIRGWLEGRFDAPVWVDNDVNLMALGELAAGGGKDLDMLFVKVGTGIGAGLISGGRVHRGANGGAGDVGHIIVTDHPAVVCRCGQTGCLEAIAGGWALARDGIVEVEQGRSPFLAARLKERGVIRPLDIVEGAVNGDPACIELVVRSGRLVGENVASMVNFFNPSLVAIGGVVARTGDLFLAAVRQTVYRRSLPLATRDLRIVPAWTNPEEGAVGGAMLVIDQLFDANNLRKWVTDGSPVRVRHALYAP